MIDPRTTNIVGAHIQLVKRADPSNIQGRGVVRVVDYNQGSFTLLIEAIGALGDGSWYSVQDGELFQVSLFDETIAVVIENASKKNSPAHDDETTAQKTTMTRPPETNPDELHDAAHAALHRCWGKAVGTSDYDKNDWKLLEHQLHAKCRGGCLMRGVYPKSTP